MKILINNKQKLVKFHLKDIQRLALKILKAANMPKYSVLSLVFCDDKAIKEINKQHRDIDEPTDVLSFPMPRDLFSGRAKYILLGDIAISVETALKQAKELKHSLMSEIAFLMIHGVLHLNGYDHIKDEDRQCMVQKEEEIYKNLYRSGFIHEWKAVSPTVIGRTEQNR